MAGERIDSVADEVDAARALLGLGVAATHGHPAVHDGASREELSRLIDGLHDDGWQAGDVLPEQAGAGGFSVRP